MASSAGVRIAGADRERAGELAIAKDDLIGHARDRDPALDAFRSSNDRRSRAAKSTARSSSRGRTQAPRNR